MRKRRQRYSPHREEDKRPSLTEIGLSWARLRELVGNREVKIKCARGKRI